MPRPIKCRKVCGIPLIREFTPVNGSGRAPVILTVDEYETIRLIDKEGLSQEECGALMEVARTTVQQIYTSARRKLADSLVDGRPLTNDGGEYRLCDGEGIHHCCGACPRCHRRQTENIQNQGPNS